MDTGRTCDPSGPIIRLLFLTIVIGPSPENQSSPLGFFSLELRRKSPFALCLGSCKDELLRDMLPAMRTQLA